MRPTRLSARHRGLAAALGASTLVVTVPGWHAPEASAAPHRRGPGATPLVYVCLSVEEERWICEGTPSTIVRDSF